MLTQYIIITSELREGRGAKAAAADASKKLSTNNYPL